MELIRDLLFNLSSPFGDQVWLIETSLINFFLQLHEAIMREDSTEFDEGIILDEFRKGFLLGDRLLRPSMVKVSAGPGPEKPAEAAPSEEHDSSENYERSNTESS